MNEPEAMAGSTYQGALLTSELQERAASTPGCMLLDDAGVITTQPCASRLSKQASCYLTLAAMRLTSFFLDLHSVLETSPARRLLRPRRHEAPG